MKQPLRHRSTKSRVHCTFYWTREPLRGGTTRNAALSNRVADLRQIGPEPQIEVAQGPETLGSFRPRYEIGMEDRNPARPGNREPPCPGDGQRL
jgi:hypothetical protein